MEQQGSTPENQLKRNRGRKHPIEEQKGQEQLENESG